MPIYEIDPIEGGYRLSGERLERPLDYVGQELQTVIGHVGFFAQKNGGILRIYDATGEMAVERMFLKSVGSLIVDKALN